MPPWAEYEDLKNKINDIVAKYNNLLVNLDSLNVVSLTADHIDAGTIDANVVTIRSDLTAGAFVEINGNGMRINNGSYDTFLADINGLVTMTGALIRSANGVYPRVEMNPNDNLFGAYAAATNYLAVLALGSSMSPQLLFSAPNSNMFMFVSGTSAILGATSADLRISSNRNVYLSPGANVYDVITPFDQFKDSSTNQTLYSMLLGKASSGVSTGSSGSHNHGIAAGTQLMVAGGGTVTWQVAPTHTHTQI
ncbi:hypothetical protein NKT34_13565 [Paenibacillus polysaccharolyticus]|uniref:hypothetical protein n=1 Tax=Paenibacillus polysaccharolyticus TaxID=582692 RepID=UPI00209DCF11|nr:hypothetical protein [Paenibacillus polysaccharolyticus]MCP1134327.1 hypothetical protein [Paenibacillus polysaccharolyticus]